MKCFYHPEVDAVGCCRSCGKGLCFESCAEIEGALACRNYCEEKVAEFMKLLGRGQRHLAHFNPVRNARITALIIACLGLGALATYLDMNLIAYLFMGLSLIGLSVYILHESKKNTL